MSESERQTMHHSAQFTRSVVSDSLPPHGLQHACSASLSIPNSQILLKLMSIASVMPSNRLILCCPLLLLPSIFPNIRVFSSDSVLHIRWPKYWSFSFVIKFLILQYHHLCRKGLVFLSRIVKLIFLKHLLDQVTLQFKILQ